MDLVQPVPQGADATDPQVGHGASEGGDLIAEEGFDVFRQVVVVVQGPAHLLEQPGELGEGIGVQHLADVGVLQPVTPGLQLVEH